MVKRLFLLIPLIISLAYTSPSDTLDYRQRKRRKAPAAYLDVSSGAQRVILSDHSYIHNYQAFTIGIIDTLGDGEVVAIAINVPDTIDFHLKSINVWAEGSPFMAKILNNPDTIRYSADTLVPQNRNQADNKGSTAFPSGCTVTDSVDTVGLTNSLDPIFFGGGSGIGQASFAGGAGTALEWIFEDDDVIVLIQNLSGDAKKASIGLFWYEIKED